MKHGFIAYVAALVLTGCARSASPESPPILLFNGVGTSANDVRAVEGVLGAAHFGYATADSRDLNGMTEAQLTRFRLLIIPGGNYLTIGNSLTPGTARHIRSAVQGGLNYLGICAGGLLAGDQGFNSLNLTAGSRFGFYAEVGRGNHIAAVPIAIANAPVMEHYWEDGPQFSGWGEVVARYPDGTPAIVQGRSGRGWLILCGVHPEAPETWRRGMTFSTPASVDNAYARTLVDAALRGVSLPHY